jgi:hypothetical protein
MKDIIRIVVKGSSGYGPADEAFKDKITVEQDRITYEYKPIFESELNQTRKWSYKTTSPVFHEQFKRISKMMSEIIENPINELCTDIGGIEFMVTFADKTKFHENYWVPGDHFVSLFRALKVMVPECEYTPAVLLTSEDYKDG